MEGYVVTFDCGGGGVCCNEARILLFFWVGSGNLLPSLAMGASENLWKSGLWSAEVRQLDLDDSGVDELEESYLMILMSICSTFPLRPEASSLTPFTKSWLLKNQRSPGTKPRPGWISKIWQPKYAQISTSLGWMWDSAPHDKPTLGKRKIIWKVNLDVEIACPTDAMTCSSSCDLSISSGSYELTLSGSIICGERSSQQWIPCAVQLDSPTNIVITFIVEKMYTKSQLGVCYAAFQEHAKTIQHPCCR